jgi:hypothetical protein
MYAKVFAQIFDSSIADDFRLRHFFMDLLVLADQDGCVDMTLSAIAARTRIPMEEVTAMIAKLEQPDPESRTPDSDGRRIERLDDHRTWGWHIINYARFRQIASDEQRKASQRERFRRWKGRHLETANAPLTPANAPLTANNASNAMQKQKQKQKQMHKQKEIEDGALAHAEEPFEHPNATERLKAKWQEWTAYRRRLGKCRDFPAMFREQMAWLANYDEAASVEILSQSLRNGYQGLFSSNGQRSTRSIPTPPPGSAF